MRGRKVRASNWGLSTWAQSTAIATDRWTSWVEERDAGIILELCLLFKHMLEVTTLQSLGHKVPVATKALHSICSVSFICKLLWRHVQANVTMALARVGSY